MGGSPLRWVAALFAASAPLSALAAPPVAKPPVPAAIYAETEAEIRGDWDENIGEPEPGEEDVGRPPVRSPDEFMFRAVEINGDGIPDWRVNFETAGYGFCGTGGCLNRLYVSRPDGTHQLVLDVGVHRILVGPPGPERGQVTIGVHGTACGGAGATECLLGFRWNEAQRRLQPAATTRSTVRIRGTELLPENADPPAAVQAEGERLAGLCAMVNARSDGFRALPAPDLDLDGRGDWVVTGGYCAATSPESGILDPPVSVFADRIDGAVKLLEWPGNAFSIDIGGAIPVFVGEKDGCGYGFGGCSATAFAWDAARSVLVAYDNSPPPPDQMEALEQAEAALQAAVFGRADPALGERVRAVRESFAAIRAPIDPLLARAQLAEAAFLIGRGESAAAEKLLRRARDIFAFSGEDYRSQFVLSYLLLARSIDDSRRREERAGYADDVFQNASGRDETPTTWAEKRGWELWLTATTCESFCYPGRELLEKVLATDVGTGPDAFATRAQLDAYASALARNDLRWTDALAIDRRLLAEARQRGAGPVERGPLHIAVARDLVGLARFDEAANASQDALDGARAAFGPSDPRTLRFASDHAAILLLAGRIAEATPLLRSAELGLAAAAEPDFALPLASRRLAQAALALGRYEEARIALERTRYSETDLVRQGLEADGYDTFGTLALLGRLLALTGKRAAAAEAFSSDASFSVTETPRPAQVSYILDFLEFAGAAATPEQLELFALRTDAGAASVPALAEKAVELATTAFPQGHPEIARAMRLRSRALIEAGDPDALTAAEESLTIAAALPGDGVSQGLEVRGDLARLLALTEGGDAARALRLAEEAAAIARDRRTRSPTGAGLDPEVRRAFVSVALAASSLGAAGGDAATAAAFAALQEADVSRAGIAAARGLLARQSAGSREAELAARLSAAEESQRALDLLYLEALGKGDAEAAARLRADLDASTAELARIDAELRTLSPSYAALAEARPLTLAEAQARLAPDAALLLIGGDDRDLVAMLVTREFTRGNVASDYTPGFEAAADRLRCAVEPGKCPTALALALDEAASEAGGDPSQFAPFDRRGAHAIYATLLAPLLDDDALRGRTLYVVQQGTTARVPLAVLPVNDPEGADPFDPAKMAAVEWLVDRHPLLTLPTVATLVLGAPAAPAGERLFLGIGNPALNGTAPDVRGIGAPRMTAVRGGGFMAEPAQLAELAPLPGTQAELEAMAALLGVEGRGAAALVTGTAATERAVKGDARVGEAALLAFATHGLLPSEAAGVTEPGLVFTPPAAASVEDDGFLAASEVAGFRLSAETVILSACNTASSDGAPGADSLSALARSFLLAGAESVLATRWSVPDLATAALTVEALRAQASGEAASRAEALRRAMIAVRRGARADGTPLAGASPAWAHPAAWGAFVTIGARE